MLLLIKYTLLYGIVLMLVALGGMFSEHSGVINIALEGIMVVGGLAGVLVTASMPTTMAPALIVLAAVVAAAVCGMLYSLLLAFASINLKADLPAHVAAKNRHAAHANGKGKERLVHGSHNDIANAHFGGTVPVRQQVERQALARAGQHKAVHSQNQDQHKQRAHHPFANAFNAVLQTAAADKKAQ